MNKPRIRIKNNDTPTVTFLNPSNRKGWQVVHINDIRKAESFFSLMQNNQKRFLRIGGLCAKNADLWLDLIKLK